MHAFDRQTDRRTDRQTDGQTEISSLDRVCIACSAVKTLVKTGYICHKFVIDCLYSRELVTNK